MLINSMDRGCRVGLCSKAMGNKVRWCKLMEDDKFCRAFRRKVYDVFVYKVEKEEILEGSRLPWRRLLSSTTQVLGNQEVEEVVENKAFLICNKDRSLPDNSTSLDKVLVDSLEAGI